MAASEGDRAVAEDAAAVVLAVGGRDAAAEGDCFERDATGGVELGDAERGRRGRRVMVLALPSKVMGVVMIGSPAGPCTPSLPWPAVRV